MDSRPIVDRNAGEMPASPNPASGTFPGAVAAAQSQSGKVRFPGEDGGKSLAEMAQRDLTATLQLLAERAQYITGATGAAIALRDQEEMVCRASAGPSAPEVGAQLQVNSGLSGESVRTRETLRCDDAFTDPRVNRESCEALGIRSVVVMPLIRGEEVIGVFELFSDKPHIFETRDLVALERMGTMVHTALEHSTAALGLPPMLGEVIQPARAAESAAPLSAPRREHLSPASSESSRMPAAREEASVVSDSEATPPRAGIVFHGKAPVSPASRPALAEPRSEPERPASVANLAAARASSRALEDDDVLEEAPAVPIPRPTEPLEVRAVTARTTFESLVNRADQEPILSDSPGSAVAAEPPATEQAVMDLPQAAERRVAMPSSAVASLRRCQECGFPVSEGRKLCLDCEKKMKAGSGGVSLKAPSPSPSASGPVSAEEQTETVSGPTPNFMGSSEAEASWLANHKFMVIALVLAAAGIVAVVALR